MFTVPTITPQQLLRTYETMSGEFGLVRYVIDVTVAEIPGFSAGSSDRVIAEAVFVRAEDLDEAVDAAAGNWYLSLTDVLTDFGIDYRLPHGVTALVHSLPTSPTWVSADAEAAA